MKSTDCVASNDTAPLTSVRRFKLLILLIFPLINGSRSQVVFVSELFIGNAQTSTHTEPFRICSAADDGKTLPRFSSIVTLLSLTMPVIFSDQLKYINVLTAMPIDTD